MESAKQRIRAAAARQKEEKKAKEAGGEASSTPTAVAKVAKRKPDGSDGRPAKKTAVTPSDEPLEKSPPTSGHGAGKGVMTSTGPVNEGPCRLLTHKEYAVGEVETLIKPTDMEPCDQVGTEDLRASALFDLSRVSFSRFWVEHAVSCFDVLFI